MRVRLPLPLKLMISYLVVAGFITLPAFFFLRGALTESLETSEERALLERAESVRGRLVHLPAADLDHVVRSDAELLGLRITVVDRSGRVLADSEVPLDKVPAMENHASRPEIASAFATGAGVAVRLSASIGRELVYVAIPLDPSATTVVRVAGPRSKIHAAVDDAFVALRVGVGIGISTALLLSLIAAMYVSSPLRRMRDVAKAYAEARWNEVKPIRTGDELEDLSVGLVELGRQLRKQLVAAGAPESLLVQALEALPATGLFSPDLEVCSVNAAFRERLGWRPDGDARVQAHARAELAKRDPNVAEPVTFRLEDDHGKPVTAQALPLSTAQGPPYWLVVLGQRAQVEAKRPPAVTSISALATLADAAAPGSAFADPTVRRHLDTIAVAFADPSSEGLLETVSTRSFVEGCVSQLNSELGASRITVSGHVPEDPVVNANGAAARCVRIVVRAAISRLAPERPLKVSASTEGAYTRIDLNAPIDVVDSDRALLESALAAAGAELAHAPDGASLRLPRA
jgi:hypothetical protein